RGARGRSRRRRRCFPGGRSRTSTQGRRRATRRAPWAWRRSRRWRRTARGRGRRGRTPARGRRGGGARRGAWGRRRAMCPEGRTVGDRPSNAPPEAGLPRPRRLRASRRDLAVTPELQRARPVERTGAPRRPPLHPPPLAMRPLALLLPFLLAACATEGAPHSTPAGTAAEADSMADAAGMADTTGVAARATIQPLGDAGVSGTVTFTPAEGGVQVTYALDGLTPGRHGFHVHENGDCGPGPDGAPGGAAGEHFAPLGSPHGAPADSVGQRHVGDLGNVEAGADGR